MSGMAPTDELRAEHDAVREMLDVLQAVAERAEHGETLDAADLDSMVRFLRVFVDRCHHAKEEEALIPEMVSAGVPRYGGMVADILREHVTGRGYVRGFDDPVEALKAGDARAHAALARNARDYVKLITAHTEKEDVEFFPMADAYLKPEQQSRLVSAFDRIESERVGHGIHEELHESLEALRQTYLGAGAGAARK